MKAMQIKAYGNNEVVCINKAVPCPLISKNEVLVKVLAAGVNPIDWKIREGHLHQQLSLNFPATLGLDFSGIVVEVGKNVKYYQCGDPVYGIANLFQGRLGSFSEFIAVDINFIAHKPISINHIQAAAMPVVSVSAWQAIIKTMALTKNDKILIHGGAGGIGSIAIQLAKHIGAHVVTTVSEKDIFYVRGLGADEVLNYRKKNFAERIQEFDFVLDNVGGDTYKNSFNVLKKGGTIVSLVEKNNQKLVDKYKVKSFQLHTKVTHLELLKINQLVNQQVLKINVDKVFALDNATEALYHQQFGHPQGKTVLSSS